MHIIPLILGILALLVFILAYGQVQVDKAGRPLIPLGLALLVAAWLLQLLIVGGDPITIG